MQAAKAPGRVLGSRGNVGLQEVGIDNRNRQYGQPVAARPRVGSSFTTSRSVCAPKARRTSRTAAVSAAVRPPCPCPPPDAFPGVFSLCSPRLDAAQRDFQYLENLPLEPREARGLQGRSSRAARVSALGFHLAPCYERTKQGGDAVGAAWPGALLPALPQPRAELCSLLEAGTDPGGAVGAEVPSLATTHVTARSAGGLAGQ